jgi:hypothetical protein
MSPEEIRLECLKLAHRHDHAPATVIDRAKEYEAFAIGGPVPSPQSSRRGGRKPADKA